MYKHSKNSLHALRDLYSQRHAAAGAAPTIGLSTGPGSAQAPRARRWPVHVGRAVLALMLWSQLLPPLGARLDWLPTAQAQPIPAAPRPGLIADPTAPLAFRPQTGNLTSGAGYVNVTTPNAAGVSLNQYQQFNVGPAGVVLNNSSTGGHALLGAGVPANPQVAGRSASTIVNEVTNSTSASELAGTLEVFGAPAALIVANPNGISCNGCGVLNTGRLTLTTGAVRFVDALGQPLAGSNAFADAQALAYDVHSGQIRIGEAGIEGTVGRLDLLGQSLSIGGPLRAHYLNQDLSSIELVAGTRRFVQQADGHWAEQSAARADRLAPAAAPNPGAMAIDASALGAMTAGQIRIVATDAGLGVNLAGPVTALQRGVQIDSAGNLQLSQAASAQDITLNAQGQLTTGTLAAGGRLQATAGGDLRLGTGSTASTEAASGVQLQAGGKLSTQGRLATTSDLTAQAGGALVLGETAASSASVTGRAELGGASVVQRGALDVGQALAIASGGDTRISGDVHATGPVQLQGGGTTTLDGRLQTEGSLNAQAGQLNISGTAIAGGDATLHAEQGVSVAGTLRAERKLAVAGRTIGISGSVTASQDLALDAGQSVSLGGSTTAGQNLAVSGPAISVTGVVTAIGDATLNGGQSVSLGGSTTVGQNLAVAAPVIGITGNVTVGRDASLAAGQELTLAGSTRVGQTLTGTAPRMVITGSVGASDTQLDADQVQLGTPGQPLNIAGDLRLNARDSLQVDDAVQVSGTAALGSAGDIRIAGAVTTGADLGLNAGRDLQVQGDLASGGSTHLRAGQALAVQGSISAGGSASATAGQTLAIGGSIAAGQNVALQAPDITVAGSIEAGGNIRASGDQAHIAGDVRSLGGIDLEANTGELRLDGAVQAGGTLRLASGLDLILPQGASAGGAMDLSAQRDLRAEGPGLTGGGVMLNAGRDLTSTALLSTAALNAQAGGALAVAGAVASNGAAALQAQGPLSIGGDTSAGAGLNLAASSLDLAGGLDAQGPVTLNATGSSTSSGDIRIAGNALTDGSMTLAASGAADVGGHLASGADLSVTTQGASRIGGQLASGANASVNSASLSAQAVGAGQAVGITTGGAITVAEQIQAGSTLQLQAGSTLASGGLQAGSTLSADSTGAQTHGGSVVAEGHAALTSQGPLSIAGELHAGGDLNVSSGTSLSVQGDASAQGQAQLYSAGSQAWGGELVAGQSIVATSGGAFGVAGTLAANGAVQVNAGQGMALGALASGGSVQLQAAGPIDVAGAVQVQGGSIQATQGGVHVGGSVSARQDLGLAAQTDLRLDGPVAVQGALQGASGTGSIVFGGDLAVGGATALRAGRDLVLGGDSQFSGAAGLTAGTAAPGGGIVNHGTLQASQGLTLTQSLDFLNEGLVQSAGALNIQARHLRSNLTSAGGIEANGPIAIDLSGRGEVGAQGHVSSAENISLASAWGFGNAGRIQSGKTLSASGSVDNSGMLAAEEIQLGHLGNAGTVCASGALLGGNTVNNGQLQAQNITLGTLSNGGTVQAADGLSLGSTSNTGQISATDIGVNGALTNSGSAQAQNSLSVLAGSAAVDNSGQLAGRSVRIESGTLSNAGLIQSSAEMKLRGGQLNNKLAETRYCIKETGPCDADSPDSDYRWRQNPGQIHAATDLLLDYQGIANKGSISATRDITLKAATSLQNTRSLNDLYAEEGSGDNAVIAAGRTFTLQAGSVSNQGGRLQAGDQLDLKLQGALRNETPLADLTGTLTGKDVKIEAASLNNEGLVMARDGDLTATLTNSVTNTSGARVVAAKAVTVTAASLSNAADTAILAEERIAISTIGALHNGGILYGRQNAPKEIVLKAGTALTNSGKVIAGEQLTVQAGSYGNSGLVGSLKDASLTLATPNPYNPANAPIQALERLTLHTAGVQVGPGQSWNSGAASMTQWDGLLVNQGSVSLAGNASGQIENQLSGPVTHSGEPMGSTTYEVLNTAPPLELAGMSEVRIVGYEDMSGRAQLYIGGALSGTLINEADAVIGGGGYAPRYLPQAILWEGKDAAGNTVAARSDSAARTLPRLQGLAGAVIDLQGSEPGTIYGDTVTIRGSDLTVGVPLDSAAAQAALAQAQGQTGPSTGAPQAGTASIRNWKAQASKADLSATQSAQAEPVPGALGQSLELPKPRTVAGGGGDFASTIAGDIARASAAALGMGAIVSPAANSSAEPNLASLNDAVARLANVAGGPLPDWGSLKGEVGQINVSNLGLELTGRLTNVGYFGVAGDLLIKAAGGIDNEAAQLLAGGRMDLSGGDLNNQGGTLRAGQTLQVAMTGDVDTSHGTVRAEQGISLTADGDILASYSDIHASAGNAIVKAGGNLDFSVARIEALQGQAALVAGGNLVLNARTDVHASSSQRSSTSIEQGEVCLQGNEDPQCSIGQITRQQSKSRTQISQTTQGSEVLGKGVLLQAGGDIDGTALSVKATGDATVLAGGSIYLRSVVQQDQESEERSESAEGRIGMSCGSDCYEDGIVVKGRTQSESKVTSQETLATSTIDAGGKLQMRAGQDIVLGAAQVRGDEEVELAAGRNVTLGAQQLNRYEQQTTNGSQSASNSTTWQGTALASGNGDVRVLANQAGQGGDVDIQGGAVTATGTVTLAGGNVTVRALQNHSEASTSSTSGKGSQSSSESWTSSGAKVHGGAGVSVVAGSLAPTTAAAGEQGEQPPPVRTAAQVILEGAKVTSGGNITLAGGDVRVSAVVERTVEKDLQGGGKNFTRSLTDVQTLAGGTVKAAGDLTVIADKAMGNEASGGNIVVRGGSLDAGPPRPSAAGAAAAVAAIAVNGGSDGAPSADDAASAQASAATPAPAPAGKLILSASGGIALEAITVNSLEETESRTKRSGFLSSKKSYDLVTIDQTQQIASELSGTSVSLNAKDGDIVSQGAKIDAKAGDAGLKASGDITLGVASASADVDEVHTKSRSGLSVNWMGASFGRNASSAEGTTDATQHMGSSVTGTNVRLDAGRDVNVVASAVIADKDLAVKAGGDINFLAAYDQLQTTSESHGSGASMGLGGIYSGLSFTRTNQDNEAKGDKASTSLLSANSGDMSLQAGGTLLTQGAVVIAQDDIDVKAARIDLQAVGDTSANRYHMDSKSVVIDSVRLTGPVGGILQQGIDMVRDGSSGNDRLDAARALKFGYDLYKNAGTIDKLLNGTTSTGLGNVAGAVGESAASGSDAALKGAQGTGSLVGVGVSSQVTQSRADGAASSLTARGTSIQGGNITMQATEGDIDAAGAKIEGKDVTLDAAQNLNLGAATNSSTVWNKSSGTSWGGGATLGAGEQTGISFQANASQFKNSDNGSETTYDNTRVTGTGTVTLRSGKDTNLVGAQVAGETVKAEVGGDLNIVTLQDQTRYESESSSSGFSLSVCIPPICYGSFLTGSVNFAESSIDHDYQSAVGQSGIAAGTGGFDINVKGNTHLAGGAITSTAAADQNSLSTGSLSFSDLLNHQNTAASASSFSASYSGGSTLATVGTNLATNTMGNLSAQRGLPDDKNEKSTTQSVISPGAITITGTDPQAKGVSEDAVAALTSRDPNTANQGLSNVLTLQETAQLARDRQKAMQDADAARLVGSVMNDVIGNLGFPPGSLGSTILHGLSGAAQAAIGGTGVLAGLFSGMANEQIVDLLSQYLEANGVPKYIDGKLNPEHRELLIAGTTVVGAGVGALAGNGATDAAAGASIAASATTYNYLEHPSKIRDPVVRDKILAAGEGCKGVGSCGSMVAALDGQIALLGDDKIAAMCAGDASCVADRTTERNTYVEARGFAVANLDPNTAAATFVNSQNNSPYDKWEIAVAVTRIQNGISDPNDPIDVYVRGAMDPVMLAAVLGLSIIDSDGGRGTGGSGKPSGNGSINTGSGVLPAGHNFSGGNAGRTAIDAAPGAMAQPSYVFRGDGRLPNDIFDRGFSATGENTSVLNHAVSNNNRGLISTSTSPNVAREFADMQVDGYVYTIRTPAGSVNVNQVLGSKSPYPDEFEVVIPGKIDPSYILGARQVGMDGKFVGPFIKNPGYQP